MYSCQKEAIFPQQRRKKKTFRCDPDIFRHVSGRCAWSSCLSLSPLKTYPRWKLYEYMIHLWVEVEGRPCCLSLYPSHSLLLFSNHRVSLSSSSIDPALVVSDRSHRVQTEVNVVVSMSYDGAGISHLINVSSHCLDLSEQGWSPLEMIVSDHATEIKREGNALMKIKHTMRYERVIDWLCILICADMRYNCMTNIQNVQIIV